MNNKTKAEKATNRVISYSRWLAKRSKIKLIEQLFLFSGTTYILLSNNVDSYFLISFLIPSLVIISTIVYLVHLSKNSTKIEEKKDEIKDTFLEILENSDIELKTDGNFDLKEVFEYKLLFDAKNTNGEITSNLLNTVKGYKLRLNPIPYLLMLMYGWVMAVEIISILTFSVFKIL